MEVSLTLNLRHMIDCPCLTASRPEDETSGGQRLQMTFCACAHLLLSTYMVLYRHLCSFILYPCAMIKYHRTAMPLSAQICPTVGDGSIQDTLLKPKPFSSCFTIKLLGIYEDPANSSTDGLFCFRYAEPKHALARMQHGHK